MCPHTPLGPKDSQPLYPQVFLQRTSVQRLRDLHLGNSSEARKDFKIREKSTDRKPKVTDKNKKVSVSKKSQERKTDNKKQNPAKDSDKKFTMKKRNPRKKVEQTETKKQENQGFVIRNRKKD